MLDGAHPLAMGFCKELGVDMVDIVKNVTANAARNCPRYII
jgi:hypothetical protein